MRSAAFPSTPRSGGNKSVGGTFIFNSQLSVFNCPDTPSFDGVRAAALPQAFPTKSDDFAGAPSDLIDFAEMNSAKSLRPTSAAAQKRRIAASGGGNRSIGDTTTRAKRGFHRAAISPMRSMDFTCAAGADFIALQTPSYHGVVVGTLPQSASPTAPSEREPKRKLWMTQKSRA